MVNLLTFILLITAWTFCHPELWKLSDKLSEWYTPFDLCLLNSTSSSDIEQVLAYCEDKIKKNGQVLRPLRCRAGNSWPSKSGFCSSADIPYSQRISLRQSIVGYDDPKLSPLRILFQSLARAKGSLLLIGDSVMQQFFSALACELERENIWKDSSLFTNTDEVRQVQVEPLENTVPIKFVPIYHFVNGRWDRIANASMHSMRKAVEDMLSTHDSLMIVMNMGLHYVDNPVAHFTRVDYQAQMTAALQYMHSIAQRMDKHVIVLWRQTSAQHFPTSNGYWPGVKYAASMKVGCTPINDTSEQGDWRNSDIRNIIHINKLTTIKVLDFYDLTVPLWSQHVNGHMRDCTHFCWTPMLYQSLFHHMAAAAEGALTTK